MFFAEVSNVPIATILLKWKVKRINWNHALFAITASGRVFG